MESESLLFENEKIEFIRLIFKGMGLLAVLIVALGEIVIKGLHKAMVFGFRAPEVVEALKSGWNTVYLVQGVITVLAGAMLAFMLFIFEWASLDDVSSNSNFDINPSDYTQVNGIVVKGENRRALSIFLCFGGLILFFVPIAFIPFAGFFVNPKNYFSSLMVKFSKSGFKCPQCRKSMEWKKLFPKGKGRLYDSSDGTHRAPSPVIDCYFWCPHCNNKCREKRVLQKIKYVSVPFDK